VALHETPDDVSPETQPPTLRAWFAQHGVTLAAIAVVIAIMARFGVDFILVGKVMVGLGLVIFIHELGHFLAAKYCDVHVETFSIGFGPPLPGCSYTWGETTYMIALIPLGGYVKMVGEGGDTEENEDDPRSFKNKTVYQRMLIISAGVIMNIILAAVCFVGVYYGSGGVERPAGVIGTVESGSPAWQKGLHSGILLTKIGDTERPYFDDVMPEVMHWPSGQPLPVTFEEFDPKPASVTVDLLPKKNESTGRPMVGIAPTYKAAIGPKSRRGLPPVVPGSAAAQAAPEFRHGDRIVGTTDPDHPDRTSPLPADPRDPEGKQPDYFELIRRQQRLAGKDMTMLVRRLDEPDTAEPVAIKVPPAYFANFGLRMTMGPVVAVRDNSPAALAKVQVKNGQEAGDKVTAIELPGPSGRTVRYTADLGVKKDPNVDEYLLDPVRLPHDLERWAESAPPGPKSVTLTVARQVGHAENKEVKLTLDWDDRWRYARSAPISPASPLAIDALGLAYSVFTFVQDVTPDSPAAKAGLKKGDLITAIQLYETDADGNVEPGKWQDLGGDNWPYAHYLAQRIDSRKIGLRVQRDQQTSFEVVLTGEPDRGWPVADRGLVFASDTRIEKADSISSALMIGLRREKKLIRDIYQNLLAMAKGQISFPKNASGPLTIAVVSYDIAGESMDRLILFLGMISVNLAVINFLPIPVLDGGHMVFLIYERLRGRPMPEQLRFAATFLGLVLIGSLMLFVIYLDVKRWLF
jgi:regulator of sigma E protease